MAMCRNDATISYFMNLQMAIFCLTNSSESLKVLCRYGKYVNLDNLLRKMIRITNPSFYMRNDNRTTFMPIFGH